jgi:hypothetical protein
MNYSQHCPHLPQIYLIFNFSIFTHFLLSEFGTLTSLSIIFLSLVLLHSLNDLTATYIESNKFYNVGRENIIEHF